MAKTTLDHIKHSLAQQKGFSNVGELREQWSRDGKYDWIDIFYSEVAKIYANSKLEEAAECATTKEIQSGNMHTFGGSIPQYIRVVDKQSILNLREKV